MVDKIRFIHTADWHILDMQYGRSFRGDDFRRAISQVVQYAVDNKVDFIVNGGDILDKDRPSGSMMDFLFDVDRRLSRAGIPMYTVTGNHDAADPSFLTLPGYKRERTDAGIVCLDYKHIAAPGGLRISGYPA